MERVLFAKAVLAALSALSGATQQSVPVPQPTEPHPWVEACEDWDEWDKPGPAFQVHGNTWYVGTCGIAAILVTSDDGHVLIDSGTQAGAELVLANIRAAGFDPADVKLLLASHEHFDHVGGMARIQEATGAPLITSLIGAQAMASGEAHSDDPQAGLHEPMRPVAKVLPFFDESAQYLLHRFGFWPIPTPGHTPGAMSWAWRACEGETCRVAVYADSLSAVSSDEYRFVDHPDYLSKFVESFERIADYGSCLLLTPHPSGSNMRGKLMGGDLAQPLAAPCDAYARQQRAELLMRLLREDPDNAYALVGLIAQGQDKR